MQSFDTRGQSLSGFAVPIMQVPGYSNIEDQGYTSSSPTPHYEDTGLSDCVSLDHSEPKNLFGNPLNVQQWAVSSAHGSAPTMDVCDSKGVNPMDLVSNGMECSFPFGNAGMPQMTPLQELENGPLGQISQGLGAMAMPGLPHTYDGNQSDTPSLEWGPAISSNDSFAGDGQSSHFQVDIPSPMDMAPNSDLVGPETSLCSPSLDSVHFSSGYDVSPVLMPSGSMGSPCESTIHPTSAMAQETDDFMLQFADSNQGFSSEPDIFSSDVTK